MQNTHTEQMQKKEKIAKNLLARGKFADAIDTYNELAHDLKKTGEMDKAMEMAEKGAALAREHQLYHNGSFCERLLSELHSQLGNRDACLKHLDEFRKMAKKCNNVSQEQLSWHVEAWCIQQLYTNGVADEQDLDRAVRAAERSIQLVDSYKQRFKDGDVGGTAKRRKADLLILQAQLCEHQNKIDKAMDLLDRAERFLCTNDKMARYELRRTKCSMAPIGRRLDIAELMDEEAPEDRKAQAICELAHHYILSNRVYSGYQKLALAYIGHSKQLEASEMEDLVRRLCISYRLVGYEKILKTHGQNAKKNRISLCELYEAIGDLYDKYYQTLLDKEKKEYRQFVRTNILRNYEKMLEHKRNENDVLRAYLAMALVHNDLDDPCKAMDFFEKRLEILKRNGAAEEKIIDTRISIFDCMCKRDAPGLEKIFEEIKAKVTLKSSRKELYEVWANYLTDNDADSARKWRDEAEKIPDVFVKNEDDETDLLFGKLTDAEILQSVVDENKLLKVETMSEYQKNKTNDKGETVLHTAAMEGDAKLVEKLCKLGCNVNAKDHGGWTPLSEAVAHEQLENVRILIRYGADTNTRSAESFVNEESCESTETSHSRLTPLMEACTNGFVDIARVLVDGKARIELRDSAGWTALDHLRHYMSEEKDRDQSVLEFETFLKNEMDRRNFPIKIPLTHGPTSTRRGTGGIPEASRDSPVDDDEECLILDNVAGRKRRNSNNSDMSASKRRPRSGENLRPLAVPPSNSNSSRKRPHHHHLPTTSTVTRRSNSPTPPPIFHHFHRQTSSNSLRGSLSPHRRSISPTNTIRSAPSIYGDVQVIGESRRRPKPRTSTSPRDRNAETTTLVQISKPSSLTRPSQVLSPKIDTVAVKCSFELPNGSERDRIPTVILPIPRFLTIGESKIRVLTHIKLTAEFAKVSVWKQDGVEKCLLADELSLAHLPDKDLALVFQLMHKSAYELYQETNDPIAEVSDRLKQLSTDLTLDLSRLHLNEKELLEVTRTFKKCERSSRFRLDISGVELSPEDESNIRQLLPECRHLTIGSTASQTGFWEIFEKCETKNLEILEILAVEFRTEMQLARILEKCDSVKELRLAGIQISNLTEPTTLPALVKLPMVIRDLPHLKKLDLSFNAWIADETWQKILEGLENLEEIVINEITSDVKFESTWLPNLCKFSARGSHLHWDTCFEMLSILEKIEKIDIRHTRIDANLVESLKNGTANLEILN